MASSTPHLSTGGAAGVSPLTAPDFHQNLQQLDRLANLGLFSAGIAHEIKNGLVAIHTHCEILLENGADVEMAGVVRRELKRIDELVTQMLRMAAPKASAMATVNIHAVMESCLRLLEHQMSGRLIGLKRDYRAQPETVCGDEARLQQVFMNLILNAVEAMSQGGSLTMASKTTDGCIRISIHDTGTGITPENQARIFDTFFTTKTHGTGLGLAICRRIVEEHDGTIEVMTEVGLGSTFIIVLPSQ